MTYQIQVSCDPNATPPVTCSPNTMEVPTGTNNIQFVMAAGQAGTIAGITWGPAGSPFETEPDSGNDWTGVDENNNDTGAMQEYAYSMGVTVNGETYWSDPEIANEPGTAPRIHHAGS